MNNSSPIECPRMERAKALTLAREKTSMNNTPYNEKRYVFGTRSGIWHLVGREDRDFAHGITQKEFGSQLESVSRQKYLSAVCV